jgi:hypothetical protein
VETAAFGCPAARAAVFAHYDANSVLRWRHLTLTCPRVYNIRVSAPLPHHEAEHRHHRHAVYASETTGLLLIALVLLVLTLIRYWHEIHWSLR